MSLADTFEELEEHLAAAFDAGLEIAEGSGMFAIGNAEKADWAIRKLATARRKLAEAEQVAEAEVARVNEWMEEQRRRHERDTAFLMHLLESYHRHVLADDPKAKTLRLPAGELVARKAPDRIAVDDDTFIAWAKANGLDALIRTKEAVDLKTAKVRLGMNAEEPDEQGRVRAIDPTTGVVVDGAWFIPGDVRFSVVTSEEVATS